MFGLSKSKPVKIRSCTENRKYGVAARDLVELLKKGCKTLQLPLVGARVCLYADGTQVTDTEFFHSLPDHTELVFLSREQTWSGAVCDIGQLLCPDQHGDDLIRAARGLLFDEKSPSRRKILTDLLRNLEDKSELESREEDEEWFQGIDARFKTKSAYMKFNCESRIRGYMKEAFLTLARDIKAKMDKKLEGNNPQGSSQGVKITEQPKKSSFFRCTLL